MVTPSALSLMVHAVGLVADGYAVGLVADGYAVGLVADGSRRRPCRAKKNYTHICRGACALFYRVAFFLVVVYGGAALWAATGVPVRVRSMGVVCSAVKR